MTSGDAYAGRVSADHLEASTKALAELCSLVSTKGGSSGEHLRLKLGHVDHGAFLTHLLHGFAVLQANASGRLIGADEGEVLYAVVVNQSVETQIQTVLSMVASFIARHDKILAITAGDQDGLDMDKQIAEVDMKAAMDLADSLRTRNWREAANDLSVRAERAGFQLTVTIASPMLSHEEIRDRIPVLRRVYNSIPRAREAVDRTASALSQGLTVQGEQVPESLMQQARALLDLGEVRRYLAHLARDAFVCGNGFLEIKEPPAGMQLLPPDTTERLSDVEFVTHDPITGQSRRVSADRVLHIRGMYEAGSSMGVSVLEPLVIVLAQLEVAEAAIEEGIPIAEQAGSAEARDWVDRTRAYGARIEAETDRRIDNLLGHGPLLLPDPPAGLYFEGHELMVPQSTRLHFLERDSP